jgi:hypothetical protein
VRSFVATGDGYSHIAPSGSNYINGSVRPEIKLLDEPCSMNALSTLARIGLGYEIVEPSFAAPPPSTNGAYIAYGNLTGITTQTDFYAICQTSEWANTSTTVYPTSNGLSTGTWTAGLTGTSSAQLGQQFQWYGSGTGSTDRVQEWGAQACPYVRSLFETVCTWSGPAVTDRICSGTVWSAEQWFQQTPYAGGTSDPMVALCTRIGSTAHPDCPFYLPNTTLDGTDFASVCGTIPAFVPPGWTNFSDWVPTFVSWWWYSTGLWARCLFVPLNGWDPGAHISNAFAASPIGVVASTVSAMGTAISVPESCGQVINTSTVAVMPSFVIDTCSFTWAAPVKAFLVIVLYGLFGFMAIRFVWRTFLGLFKVAPVPDPMDMANMTIGATEPTEW